LERIFSEMGGDAKRGGFVEVREDVIGTERDEYFISDSLHVKSQMGRRLEGQPACQ
jgi:hypothetical protein